MVPLSVTEKGDLQPSPKRGPKGDQGKESSAIAKQTKAGISLEELYARVWINRISTKEKKPEVPRGKQQPQIQFHWPDHDMKVVQVQDVGPNRGVIFKNGSGTMIAYLSRYR